MFHDIQIVIITNFVVASSVGIKRVNCRLLFKRDANIRLREMPRVRVYTSSGPFGLMVSYVLNNTSSTIC